MNLSPSFILSSQQAEVLERGLTFIPTPTRQDHGELRRDLYKYHRRLRLLDYFQYNSDFPHLPFLDPSAWAPPPEAASESVRTLIQQDIRALSSHRFRPPLRRNLTRMQQRALKGLRDNKNIIIKPADKGSQIVIMDKAQYLLEAQRQLNNNKHYAPLSGSIQNDTRTMIQEILQEVLDKRLITRKQFTYLTGPDEPRARQFYLLPKIHKAPEGWTVPFKVPMGRPIVSDCGSESCRIAEFIDYHINPLSQKHASYVKDTYDFVNKLSTVRAPPEAFLFSIDISSLYTNIDTELGLQAVRKAFDTYPDSSRPDGALLQLLELSLTRNDFEFNGKFYLQVHGTAMGKKFAPAYANLYMCVWEETAFLKCKTLPLMYLRYLDDIFGIWGGSREDFLEFLDILDNHHPAIKITHNTQKDQLEFLDTQVFFIANDTGTKTLGTRVWFKDTDRHALLHKASFHPRHTFKGIIKSQLIRFHRICTFMEDVDTATRTLFAALEPRGYTKRFLRHIRTEVRKSFVKSGTYQKTTDDRPLIPFVSTFSLSTVRLGSQLRANFQEALEHNLALRDFRIISAYRRNKNLRDILVHSKMEQKPCHIEYFTYLKFLTNPFSGKGAPVWQNIGLKTRNVVYGIRCLQCKSVYIGETQNTLIERIKQHRYKIRTGNKDSLLYVHFQTHTIDNMQAFGLESKRDWSLLQRKRAENIWIKNLNTIEPLGLNMKSSSS